MQKHFTFIIILSFTFFGACHKKELPKTSVKDKLSPEKTITSTVIKDAIINPDVDMSNTGNAYTIDSLKIIADVLSVFVSYPGCCTENSFELYSNGMYAKSLPPQLSLCLKHTSKGDPCRRLVTQELKFNILKLKYPGKNTVILKLGDTKRVTYISK